MVLEKREIRRWRRKYAVNAPYRVIFGMNFSVFISLCPPQAAHGPQANPIDMLLRLADCDLPEDIAQWLTAGIDQYPSSDSCLGILWCGYPNGALSVVNSAAEYVSSKSLGGCQSRI